MSKANTTIIHQGTIPSDPESLVAMAVYHKDSLAWLEQSVASIINQSYQNFVFLIVIDGDVDDTISAFLSEAATQNPRIVIAQNAENSGLAASMNYAIEWGMALNFSFFFRMDADDVSLPQRLEKQVSYLKGHRQVGVLGTALTEINEHGEKVGARVMPASHAQIVRVLPRRCSVNHPTVAFRYDVFRRGFRYDAELMNTQDYFLWIQLAHEGIMFRNLKERLLEFRRVNNFYKRRGLTKSLNEFRARLYAMRSLGRFTLWNLTYACGVLAMRLMPAKVVKLAYKYDRHMLEKRHKS